MRSEVERTVKERQADAQGREIRLRVITEIFGIAEDVAGAPPVIVEPAAQRQDRGGEPRDVAERRTAARPVLQSTPGFASCEGHGGADGGFLGQRCERKAERGREDTAGAASGNKEGQSPQGESSCEEIRVGQRALSEPYRIERCEERRRGGDRSLTGHALGEPVDRQQRRGGDDQFCEPRGERIEAGEFPPEG